MLSSDCSHHCEPPLPINPCSLSSHQSEDHVLFNAHLSAQSCQSTYVKTQCICFLLETPQNYLTCPSNSALTYNLATWLFLNKLLVKKLKKKTTKTRSLTCRFETCYVEQANLKFRDPSASDELISSNYFLILGLDTGSPACPKLHINRLAFNS